MLTGSAEKLTKLTVSYLTITYLLLDFIKSKLQVITFQITDNNYHWIPHQIVEIRGVLSI